MSEDLLKGEFSKALREMRLAGKAYVRAVKALEAKSDGENLGEVVDSMEELASELEAQTGYIESLGNGETAEDDDDEEGED